MFADNLLANLTSHGDNTAIVYQDKTYSYDCLASRVNKLRKVFASDINSGDAVLLVSDYSPEAVASFIALQLNKAIVIPLTVLPEAGLDDIAQLTQATYLLSVDTDQAVTSKKISSNIRSSNELYEKLRSDQHAGLVILSSGSTGKPKAIVHDVERLFAKVKSTKSHLSVLSFLLFDHIGGLNALVSALYSGNTLVFPSLRQPEEVASAMQRHDVNVLITSPSFLNLLCLKQVFTQGSFEALQQINYGSEVMPQALLDKLHMLLPKVRLTQAYGMSELGVIPARSENETSLRLQIDQSKVQYRIRNQQLEIKATQSMLGYLNAPSPYTEDGWFKTGDRVVQEGDFLRILGRESDLINVGGEKVFPAEIEAILLKMEHVDDVTVFGEAHGILGQRVTATFSLNTQQTRSEFYSVMRTFCLQFLPTFKIPQKINLVDQLDYGHRFKKNRQMKKIA